MKKNLFIVNTPVQILNAAEARDRFHSGQCNSLAILRSPLPRKQASRRDSYQKMLKELVDDQWDTVWAPKLTKINKLYFSVLAAGFINKHQPCELIYTGAFQSSEMHIINSINHKKLVLMDDGIGIHETIDAYEWKERRVRLRDRIQFKKTTWPSGELNVFSCYDVDQSRCEVIRNDYRSLREKIPSNLPMREKEIVFLSQPLQSAFPNVSIKTQELLAYVSNALSVENCRCLAHPSEAFSGFKAESLEYPVELFPIREGYLPGAFVTFFSSAARTLRLLYQVPVVCLRPSRDFWPDASWADFMSRCYKELETTGASIMDIDSGFYEENGKGKARAPWAYQR